MGLMSLWDLVRDLEFPWDMEDHMLASLLQGISLPGLCLEELLELHGRVTHENTHTHSQTHTHKYLHVNGYNFRESNSAIFIIASFPSRGQFLKERTCC